MKARHRIFTVPLCLALAILLAACSKEESKTPGAVEPGAATAGTSASQSAEAGAQAALGTGDALALGAEYAKRCNDGQPLSHECEILQGLLVVEVTTALEDVARARDKRGAPTALAALDLVDEPEILVAACRILAQFPDTPGVAEKTLPLVLQSPYVAVQQVAANLLANTPDPAFAAVGSLWSGNHSALSPANTYEEYPDFPAHYAAMKFPAYPGAEWFSPADSDRSIGWSTPDDVATVASWFSHELSTEPMDFQGWSDRSTAQLTNAMQSIDQSKVKRVQELAEQLEKTQDLSLLEEIQKLQEEMNAPIAAANANSDLGAEKVAVPGVSSAIQDARYIVAEEKAGHVARVVLVYRLPGVERTVVQMAWNLADYPSAWPAVEDGEQ